METPLRKGADEMLDPNTGRAVQVDPRLLNKNDWTNCPRLIQALLDEAACCGEPSGLATLAACYLALASTEFPINRSGQTAACDVFIVPGHELNADTTPKPELVARLEMALLASQRHPKAKLLVSGAGQATGVKEAAVMRHWLINRGVSEKRVLTECRSRDTVENIALSVAMLDQDVRTVCLISGFQHVVRAVSLLSSYLSHINAKIGASCLVSGTPAGRACLSREDSAGERFLLFKDLGRILGIWRYREWRRQPETRLPFQVESDVGRARSMAATGFNPDSGMSPWR